MAYLTAHSKWFQNRKMIVLKFTMNTEASTQE